MRVRVVITREEIMAKKTKAGGWTWQQLMAWGVKPPPRRGWIDRLVRHGYEVEEGRHAV